MMIYSAGKQVTYQSRFYTVDHVHLSGYELKIHLIGLAHSVSADEVFCEPSIFKLPHEREDV